MIGIHEALGNDLNAIRDIAQKTWPSAYGDIISGEQIDYMIGLFYSDEKLNADLESGQKFLLAKDAGRFLGFAGIEHRWKDRPVTRIHKIYILPSQQGTGIGKWLMEEIQARAVAAGDKILSLNVNRQNPAQSFYRKLGFEIVKSEDIDIGRGYLMEDYVMEKPVTP